MLALQKRLLLLAGDQSGAVAALQGHLQRNTQSLLLAGSEVLAARRLLGQLQGGDEGARMSESAEEALRALGVVDRERSCQMLLPGGFLA